MGEIAFIKPDQAIEEHIASHPDEIGLISFALDRHWPAFRLLDHDSKERWSSGIHLLIAKPYGQPSAGFAVHAFTGVVERVLRESIFIPFRRDCQLNPELAGDISTPAENGKIFCEFLSGKQQGAPTLGQMLIISKLSIKSSQTPFVRFAEWIKTQWPAYLERIGQIPEQKVIELRNREDHAKMSLITETEAEKILEASKEILEGVDPRHDRS